jgi:site-specific DNA-methyltransferase (adenine-specific)
MEGDVREWAASYSGLPFHALLSDPPYSLGNGKKGFMGKVWDTDIASNKETWSLLAKHLLPGAFGMVFASSRGYHRVACAIEDAGLILHPSFFGWVTAQGFPKATNISVGIDKRLANIGPRGKAFKTAGAGDREDLQGKNGKAGMAYDAPISAEAQVWRGHRYGLQCLKPALEPIILFQKGYSGKPIDSIMKYGAGALNIDDARIPSEKIYTSRNIALGSSSGGIYSPANIPAQFESHDNGRWPANFYVDEEGARRLDKQSGVLSSTRNKKSDGRSQLNGSVPLHGTASLGRRDPNNSYADSGGASRFFFNVESQIDESDPIFYSPKASRKERDNGLDGVGGLPLQSAGTMEDFPAKATPRMLRKSTKRRNTHPCVKPLSFCKWLATLLLPPDAYAPRRLLVPFSGTSSEMIGALQVGWERVLGIEQEKDYVEIAKKRISYWIQK